MKLGIIRCMQTEDYCPGTTDFAFIRAKKGVFADVEGDIEIIGFTNCGGCRARKWRCGRAIWSSAASIPLPSLPVSERERLSVIPVLLRKSWKNLSARKREKL